MADTRPHAVYRRLMISRGNGYPFWEPNIDESLPLSYRQNGMRIGDLVILNGDGGYIYIFNVHTPAEDSVNINGVPSGFVPLQVNHAPRFLPHCHNANTIWTATDHSTHSVDAEASAELLTIAGAGFSFGISTSSAEAAVLALPDGAARYDASNERAYEEYAEKHAESWFDFVENKLGKRLPTNSLYLVTGCDKSRSWCVALVHGSIDSRHCALKFTVGGIAGGGMSYSKESGILHKRPDYHYYPPTAINQSGPVNQCVFARGLTITTKRSRWKRKTSVKVSWIDGSSTDTCPPFIKKKSPQSGSGSLNPDIHRQITSTTDMDVDEEDFPISSDSDTVSESTSEEMFSNGLKINVDWSWNPSTHLSQWMLNKCPNAEISIVSDREWMPYVRDTPALTVEDIVNKVVANRGLAIVKDIATFPGSSQDRPGAHPTPTSTRSGSLNPQPVSISDDGADFVFKIEDADSADHRRDVRFPSIFGSGESLFLDGSSGGAPSSYTSGDPSYRGSPSAGSESDNSSSGYHTPAVSDADSFEGFQPSLPFAPYPLFPAVNINSRESTNEFASQSWQTSGQSAEGGLPYSENTLSYPHRLQHRQSAPLQPHLEVHPTPPSQRSLHEHYDHTPHELPASEPPSPTDYDPITSLMPGYLNYAQPAHAPSPTASESAASDASSNSARSSRGRDHSAINKRRKNPAIYYCPDCDEADFTTKARLKSHVDSKHKLMRHRCSFSGCGKVFKHLPSLTRHLNDKHRSSGAASGSQPLGQPRSHGEDAFIPA